jgi:hypothetical protein
MEIQKQIKKEPITDSQRRGMLSKWADVLERFVASSMALLSSSCHQYYINLMNLSITFNGYMQNLK